MITLPGAIVDLCGNDFLLPYLYREFGVADDADASAAEAEKARGIVRVFTNESEASETLPMTGGGDLPVAVIRCPYIVGTGMNGFPMRLASGISRGTYVGIKGNEARISVAHAVDVARAVKLAAGTQGTYVLTDETDPTIDELAEALAYRIKEKRIWYVKPRWAKLWYGRSYFDFLTTSHVEASTFAQVFADFRPVSVCEYLRTHVYDESSL